MRVLHIVPYLPKASGVTTFVDELCRQLVTRGVGCSVAVEMMNCGAQGMTDVKGVPRISVEEALATIKNFDLVHIHGIWRPCMHKFVVIVRKLNKPIVWSLHGMLSPSAMATKWWKKLPVWWLWQKRDLKRATVFHATSETEMDWIYSHGFHVYGVTIPLGTHLPSGIVDRSGHIEKTLLFVGRINPIKGLESLLRAWKRCKDSGSMNHWRLRLVGTDEAHYQPYLQKLADDLGLSDDVIFAGPKYGEDLEFEYRNADATVLPSFSENFGGVVVDALSFELPVIASVGTPWSELVEQNCGWWCENTLDPLSRTLRELIDSNSAELREKGRRGREWVRQKYSWETIGERFCKLYYTITEGDIKQCIYC